MAGRMGNDTVTVKGLMVMSVSEDEMVIKGMVPGARTALISIVSAS